MGTSGDHLTWSSGLDGEDPWSRAVVLTLDGSGYHVLSTLMMLARLMKEIEEIERKDFPKHPGSAASPLLESSQIEQEYRKLEDTWTKVGYKSKQSGRHPSRYLPCHYFDYIASTSTGGLIALMLGRLRMDVEAALDLYLDLMPQLYDLRPRSTMMKLRDSVSRKAGFLEAKRDDLHAAIRKLGDTRLESAKGCCRTIVLSFENQETGEALPYLFRSYWSAKSDRISDGYDRSGESHTWKLSLSEVAEAASCNPYSFKPVDIGGRKFFDAGFVITNPTSLVLDEIAQVQRTSKDDRVKYPIQTLISIGSGYSKPQEPPRRRKFSRIRNSRQTRTELLWRINQGLWNTSERVHEGIEKEADGFDYFRLNAKFDDVSKSFANFIARGKPQTLRKVIEDMTWTYLGTDEAKNDIRESAIQLVRLRRQRAMHRRWEKFAFGWCYQCHECKVSAKNFDEDYDSRSDLLDHLFMAHGYPSLDSQDSKDYERVKLAVDKSRTNSD